ncbi:MAG: DUF3135 domain-containing protein [Candidatus Gracilibacteria bacterium]|nr:DUF3135 domain-containing protein [Candidatus Gracilibacteria bacterium]
MTELDIYDRLVSLRDDPDAFEMEKQKILNEEISKFPEKYKQKALKLQWSLEGELRKFKNPTARYNRMVELFWEQFYEFNLAIGNFQKILSSMIKSDDN